MSKVYLNTEQRISKINKCWLLHLSSVHSISCTISTGSTINRFFFFGLNHSCFFLHVSWTVSQPVGEGHLVVFPWGLLPWVNIWKLLSHILYSFRVVSSRRNLVSVTPSRLEVEVLFVFHFRKKKQETIKIYFLFYIQVAGFFFVPCVTCCIRVILR